MTGHYTSRQARATIAAVLQKRALLERLTHELRIAEHYDTVSCNRRSVFRFDTNPAALADVLPLYQRTDRDTRSLIDYNYRFLLRHMLEAMAPGEKPRRVDFDALPIAARPYLLAPYLGLVVGNAFPHLDLDRSQPHQGELTYIHTGGPADPDAWRPLMPRASAWLGANWKLHGATATSVSLIRRAELPRAIAMRPDYLRRGGLFMGLDTETNQPTYLPFADMTSGTFVVGASGSGKSNATHILMRSILANLDQFRIVVCIDGKEGLTFDRYRRVNPRKVKVFVDDDQVWTVAAQLEHIIRKRNTALRAAGQDKATGDFIAVLIEEMATYTPKPSLADKDLNKRHAQFLDHLVAVVRKGRSAGLRLIVTAQEPVDAQIPTTIRANCQTTLAFRTPVDAHATTLFGQLDPLTDPRKLVTGRAVLKRDNGTVQLVQFPVIQSDR